MLKPCPMRLFQKDRVPKPHGTQPWSAPASGRLEIELGSGVGMFMIRQAMQRPEATFVAIERTQERFAKMKHRYLTHGSPNNLTIERADAVSWISHHLDKPRVDTYYLLYPNPYPKRSQHHRRWHHLPFMSHLIHTLDQKGSIVLATNVAEYAEDACAAMTQRWGLELKEKTDLTALFKARTHFEKKYLNRGDPCVNLVFSRKSP